MALTATPENLKGKPVVEFRKDDYNAAIWAKGYPILIEKALRCPCEGVDGNPLSNCQNCQGSGYFYVNPIETIGLITGINRNTEYKEWSAELIGTISLTVRDFETNDQEKIAFYDRITLLQRRSDQPKVFGYHSEVLRIRENNSGGKFVFLAYKPQQVIDIFVYTASNQPLTRVTDFEINTSNPYVIDLPTLGVISNGVISIRYKHDIQYHVIDIPHELRHSVIKNKNGRLDTTVLPINAICRRSHLVQIKANYDGSGVQGNTYLTE